MNAGRVSLASLALAAACARSLPANDPRVAPIAVAPAHESGDGAGRMATAPRSEGSQDPRDGEPAGPSPALSGCGHPGRGDDFIERLLAADRARFGRVLDHAEAMHAQVLVGEVAQDAGGRRCLLTYGWRADAEYFYPASAIKTVGAVAALSLLEARPGTSVDDPLVIEPLSVSISGALVDVTQGRSGATLRQLLESTLIVSDNQAFNALVELAGMERLHTTMWGAGMRSVRVQHRLQMGGADPETHRFSPAVWVGAEGRRARLADVREASPEFMAGLRVAMPGTDLGTSFVDDRSGATVPEPMDFAVKNYASLRDLQRIVVEVVDPALDGDETNIVLTPEHRALLREIMARRPPAPAGGTVEDAEARFKPLAPGISAVVPRDRYEYVNKAGRALGAHVESAYVRHLDNDRAFFVAVHVMVDVDGCLNDDTYAYDEISYPFFVALGEALARALLLD